MGTATRVTNGTRLKALREANGITRAELAEATGYSVAAIANAEMYNDTLGTAKLIKVAEYLGVTMDELVVKDSSA